MNARIWGLKFWGTLAPLWVLLAGCSDSSSRPVDTGASATTGDDGDADTNDSSDTDDGEGDSEEGAVCLAQNCAEDLDCAGCEDGKTVCYAEEKRCLSCNPDTGEGCDDGETCTQYGDCVPEEVTCEVGDDGEPTVSCSTDDDCAACDERHRICDTETNSCVACSAENSDACLPIEHCDAGDCVLDCPDTCDTNADCSQCGEADSEARACHRHRCAECSDDVPCPGNQVCNDQGVCVDFCGIPGEAAGTCNDDADCGGCPAGLQNCAAPINGGHGQCGAEAAGCSDLGDGVVVLPEPYDEVTNLCSSDVDCSGIGIQYNVGALLRDLTGIDDINDANVFYPMASCANVTVGVGDNSLSCGVCVPCQSDNDCQDINIDMVAGEAFGPLGSIVSALLLDQLFGAESHEIHMFCQEVGAGYGACLPCPTLVGDCTGTLGNGNTGSGSCDHDVCEEGAALDTSCGQCAANVCDADPYCCTDTWDAICVGEVETECAGSCTGGSQCTHNQCTAGEALDASCNSCTAAVCFADPYCCQTEWDSVCVGEVQTECGGDCGGGGCIHDECVQGGPLTSSCSSCASDVCSYDPYCCSTDWDQQCIDEAESQCGISCGTTSGCGHDECLSGPQLADNCSPCVGAICDADPYCCDVAWDQTCVNAVDTVCFPPC
jgi:hypothetical protein